MTIRPFSKLNGALVAVLTFFALSTTLSRATIVISEIMNNPVAVSDLVGEWFEVYNNSATPIDLNGWDLVDTGGGGRVTNNIVNGGPLIVPPFGFLVIGNDTNTLNNGGAPVDFQWPGPFGLGNGFDGFELLDTNGAVIAAVSYDNGATFPDPGTLDTASMYLTDPSLDFTLGVNWALSTTSVNWPTSAGDFGSPGAANETGNWGGAVSNVPPTLLPIANRIVIEGSPLNFDVVATESFDNDVITLSATNLPSGATFPTANNAGGVTSTFDWVIAGSVGVYTSTFFASDVDGVVSQTITITVAPQPVAAPFWINEIHYENAGAETNEGFEIMGLKFTDLSGYFVLLVNGANGMIYNQIPLSGVFSNESCDYGAIWFDAPGMQNDTDGLALMDPASNYVQFLSYEGSFIAQESPLLGVVSEDIGFESAFTPVGDSLQLSGAGTNYLDFSWVGPIGSTPNALNTGQSIAGCTPSNQPPVLVPIGNRVVVDTNANLIFDVVANDPFDGDDIGIWATGLPSGAMFPPTTNTAAVTNTFSWPGLGGVGIYTMTFFAADGNGTVFEEITIQVIPPPVPPDVVISEVFYDPSSLNEAGKEWFEIFNRSASNTMNLAGWGIHIGSSNGAPDHVITNTIFLAPYQFFVIGSDANFATNGGVVLDYEWSGMPALDNDGPSIHLVDATNGYVTGGDFDESVYPVAIAASLSLCDPDLNIGDPANWFEAVQRWETSAFGDRGTPGAPNDKGTWGTNQPPILRFIGDRFVFEGNSLVFDVLAFDQDGSLVTLTASNLPTGAMFPSVMGTGSVTGQLLWVGATTSGLYNVDFYVSSPDVSGTNIEFKVETIQIDVRPQISVWINEMDYDQPGSDQEEWVEIIGLAGVDLADYELVFINGVTGNPYRTNDFANAPGSTVFSNEVDGYGFFVIGDVGFADWDPPDSNWYYLFPGSEAIQNGPQDIVVLQRKSPQQNVHILHYEGAGVGPAADQVIATNVSELENGGNTNMTVYLAGGPGTGFLDFYWTNGFTLGTPGALNPGQSLGIPCPGDTDCDGCSDASEIGIFGTDINDPTDCPRILHVLATGMTIRLIYDSTDATTSTVQYSDSLLPPVTWTTIGVVTGGQPTATFHDLNILIPATNGAYRIRYPDDL